MSMMMNGSVSDAAALVIVTLRAGFVSFRRDEAVIGRLEQEPAAI